MFHNFVVYELVRRSPQVGPRGYRTKFGNNERQVVIASGAIQAIRPAGIWKLPATAFEYKTIKAIHAMGGAPGLSTLFLRLRDMHRDRRQYNLTKDQFNLYGPCIVDAGKFGPRMEGDSGFNWCQHYIERCTAPADHVLAHKRALRLLLIGVPVIGEVRREQRRTWQSIRDRLKSKNLYLLEGVMSIEF